MATDNTLRWNEKGLEFYSFFDILIVEHFEEDSKRLFTKNLGFYL